MHFDSVGGYRADMPGIGFAGPVVSPDIAQRPTGGNRHPVVAGHAVKGNVFETEGAYGLKRKVFRFGLDFLQTDYIGIFAFDNLSEAVKTDSQ